MDFPLTCVPAHCVIFACFSSVDAETFPLGAYGSSWASTGGGQQSPPPSPKKESKGLKKLKLQRSLPNRAGAKRQDRGAGMARSMSSSHTEPNLAAATSSSSSSAGRLWAFEAPVCRDVKEMPSLADGFLVMVGGSSVLSVCVCVCACGGLVCVCFVSVWLSVCLSVCLS